MNITSFNGQYNWLSNMYPVDIELSSEGFASLPVVLQSAEAAYQALKSSSPRDWKKFQGLTGYEAKRLGRTLPLRRDWDKVKIRVMTLILTAKFSDPELRKRLIETQDMPIIEGNTWHDNFWGDCQCPRCEDIRGQNVLGVLLMALRTRLQQQEDTE